MRWSELPAGFLPKRRGSALEEGSGLLNLGVDVSSLASRRNWCDYMSPLCAGFRRTSGQPSVDLYASDDGSFPAPLEETWDRTGISGLPVPLGVWLRTSCVDVMRLGEVRRPTHAFPVGRGIRLSTVEVPEAEGRAREREGFRGRTWHKLVSTNSEQSQQPA